MNHLPKRQRKTHPKETVNVLSNVSFFYVLRLFKKGYKNEFEQEDLYDVPRALKSEKLGAVLERQWKEQKNPKLIRLLCSSFGICYFSLGLMKLLANTLFLIIHPYALSRLLSYFSPGQDLSKNHAYFYATLVTVFSIAQTIFSHNYFLFLTGLGIRIRTALCSFLYRRLLQMSSNHSRKIPFGRIVTLLTKDVQTFESFVKCGNELWIGIVKLMASSYILYDKTGPSGLAGLAVFAIAVPLHGYLGQNIMLLKKRMCEETDERFQTTHEALSAIKSVKMNTWEGYICSKVSEARKKEIQTIFEIQILTFIGLTIGGLTSRAAVHVLIMTQVWLANDTTAETIFFSLNCYYLLSDSLTTLLPLAVYKASELAAAIKRLEEFVENPHREQEISTKSCSSSKISLFGDNKKNEKLENGLTVVTGPIGSGKTLLLITTLENLHQEDRNLVQKSVSYVPQDPWCFPSTVRQNILFGNKYEEKRYRTVLEVCDLLHDLELMENGDLTIIQNGGFNLSKDQQVKINLARGVYKKSDIYLIDDCLSCFDIQMSDFIFSECVLNFLKDKTVVLVSHNWEYLEQSNKLVNANNGSTVDIVNTYKFKNGDDTNGDKMFPGKLAKTKKKSTDVESKLLLENTTDTDVYHEVKKSGEVDVRIYQEYLKLAGGLTLFLTVFCVFVLTQIVTTSTDDLVTSWVNLEVFATQTNATLLERLERRREVVPSFYTLMTLLEVVTSLAKYCAIFLLSRKISTKLHRKLITNIVRAPMTFFHTNLIGNILNRLSGDLVTIDEVVPLVINNLFQNFLKFVEIITLTAHINPLLLVPTSFLATLLIFFRGWCLHTGRSLKRLAAGTRSPVIGHMKDTLEGMTTIKAFHAETRLKDEFNDHLDVNTSACYILQCTTKGFAFFVEIICNLYVGIVIVVLLTVHDPVNPKSNLFEDVGFVITHTLLLIQLLQRVFYQWTEVETQMTALERIFEYVDVESESQVGKTIENWPKFGEMEVENLRLENNSEDTFFVGLVKAHEKIGISGTSESSKSLIISRLLRLYPSHYTIIIDGVDIKALSLNSLRSKISVLSQDPVVLTGTIRDNIDPNGKHTDEEIWRVIEVVGLKSVIFDLDSVVLAGGSNFNQGQKQLLCLARALALGNKIVIVDNITAQLDSQTRCLVRDVIKTSFSFCTCIIFDQHLCSTLRCDRNI